MENQIYIELTRWGIAISVIIALIFFIKALTELIKARKNGENGKKIDNLEKLVHNDIRHELDALWIEFRDFREETRDNLQKLDERVRKVEIECKSRKK
ncbi:MAG: hypothetical protein KatS3mg096_741 [Candidatus Parcubacteria bacterium]|nr:MAG: hypothetical protein KatS3mg096_741 [Candidatus Parcubacteria bacterium]